MYANNTHSAFEQFFLFLINLFMDIAESTLFMIGIFTAVVGIIFSIRRFIFSRDDGKIGNHGFWMVLLGSGVSYFALTSYPITNYFWIACTFWSLFASWAVKDIFLGAFGRGGENFSWSIELTPELKIRKVDANHAGALAGETKIRNIGTYHVGNLQKIPRNHQSEYKYVPRSSPIKLFLLCVVMLIFGVALSLVGLAAGMKKFHLMKNAIHVSGIVEKIVTHQGRRAIHYFPVVRFITDDGRILHFKDGTPGNWLSYEVGDTVSIMYLSDRPLQSAEIDHGIWSWEYPALALFFSAMLLLGVYGGARQLRQ